MPALKSPGRVRWLLNLLAGLLLCHVPNLATTAEPKHPNEHGTHASARILDARDFGVLGDGSGATADAAFIER